MQMIRILSSNGDNNFFTFKKKHKYDFIALNFAVNNLLDIQLLPNIPKC
jgi:myo-inositol-hexaphosphate 3-phosphohydrolase